MARHVVNAPAGEDQIEPSRRQHVGHRSLEPVDVHFARTSEPSGFLEAFGGEIDAGHDATQLGEEHAVAAFSASEVEHAVAGPHEPGDLDRECRRIGPEDIASRRPRILERPRTPRRLRAL
jgi:hypothetical protein